MTDPKHFDPNMLHEMIAVIMKANAVFLETIMEAGGQGITVTALHAVVPDVRADTFAVMIEQFQNTGAAKLSGDRLFATALTKSVARIMRLNSQGINRSN